VTTVLLTGFDPFAGDDRNPSGEAVAEAALTWAGPETLVTATLPVEFDAAADDLRGLIAEFAPDVVIATGLAGGRTQVTPERVAINLRDARIPDSAGAQPLDEPCVPGGPAAYFASVPVKAIAGAVAAAGIPAAVSHSAGTFVCNHVFYVAAHEAARRPGMRAGFVHLPWSTETAPAGQPSLPAVDLAHALQLAVRTALDVAVDTPAATGSLH
jgi:pyroglutamyl-peptidase